MGSYSNTLRYTGLSGIDTETMIQSLMKAESMKYNKLEQSRSLLQWKQDAYRSVATSLTSFQSQFLSFSSAATNMRASATYQSFKFSTTIGGQVSSSVKVSAGNDARAGTHKLEVKQLAQSDLYSGSIQNENAKGTTAVNLENLSEGGSFNVKMDNGVAKTITFSKDEIREITSAADSNDKLEKMLNDKLREAFGTEPRGVGDTTEVAKVTASVGSDGKISFKPKSGHSITLSNTTPRVEQKLSTFNEEGLAAILEGLGEGGTFTFNVKSGSDTVGKDVTVTIPRAEPGKTADARLSEIITAVNKGFSDAGFGSVRLSSSKVEGNYTLKLAVSNTDANITIGETTSGGAGIMSRLGFDNSVSFKSTNILSDFGFKNNTGSKLDTSKKIKDVFAGLAGAQSITINGKKIEFNGDETINSLMKKVNDSGAGVTMKYNSSTEKFEIEASNPGLENKIKFGTDSGTDGFKVAFGFGSEASIKAQDSIVVLDNQTFYRSSNNVELEGLNIQLIEKTEDGKPITITAERDTSATFDSIKSFVESYNKLLETLQNEYSTTRSKKSKYDFYQPLTSEEKKAMTETEIANWEKEAKTGMLYRDDTVNDILTTMRSIMYEKVQLDDNSSISLFEIGITTSSDTKDGGKLVIDENKLRAALTERGDDVATLFTKSSSKYPTRTEANYRDRLKDEGLAERLNDIVNYATSSATGTITLKAGIKGGSSETLNDMYKQMKDMDDRLYDLYQSLIDKEDYYYKMFSKMESVITQNNNQMSTLQSMFGL